MMAAIGKLVVGILISTIYVFVAWRLWGWFAIPIGAPHIGFWAAFGLYTLAASVLIWGVTVKKDQTSEEAFAIGFAKAVVALILLGEGWAAHLLIGAGFA